VSWFCFWRFFFFAFLFVVLRGGLHGGVDIGYFGVMLVVTGIGFRGDAHGGWC